MKIINKMLKIIIILFVIINTYYIYQKYKIHFNVSMISDGFTKKANKKEASLYDDKNKIDPSFRRNALPIRSASKLEIDIVIPIVEKDLETAIHTINSIRKLVMHKLGKIYLVAPNIDKIIDFAKEHNCEFVDENQVLPDPKLKQYGGWIIQQFIKLNMQDIVEKEHYLVVDADTFFLRPVVFMQNNLYLVNVHIDCCKLRKTYTSNILNNKKTYAYDFVAHHMLFSKKILQQMKQHIENIHNDVWYKVFLKSFVNDQISLRGFSEYELYTTYLTEFTQEKFKFVSSANLPMHRNFLASVEQIIKAYAADYKSISLHHCLM